MRFAVAALMGLALTATVEAQELPRPAMDYVITLPGGQTTSVSKYKGKVVALEFLLTTCPHCQRTAKTLTQATKDFGAKGFQSSPAAQMSKATTQAARRKDKRTTD